MLLVIIAGLAWTGGFFLEQDTWCVLFSAVTLYRPTTAGVT